MNVRIQPCSRFMAKQAVGRWHYSKLMPSARQVSFGVYENARFIGAVLFGLGASPMIGNQFNLVQRDGAEVMELSRVALDAHTTPTSRIVAIAVRLLRRAEPQLRLLVSFADPQQGHHGGIYQAGGWAYLGLATSFAFRVLGEVVHPKTLYRRYGVGGQSVPWLRERIDPQAVKIILPCKHKYVLPLDTGMRALVAPLAQPYPRAGSIDSDALAIHAREGGAHPTSALDLFGDVA